MELPEIIAFFGRLKREFPRRLDMHEALTAAEGLLMRREAVVTPVTGVVTKPASVTTVTSPVGNVTTGVTSVTKAKPKRDRAAYMRARRAAEKGTETRA